MKRPWLSGMFFASYNEAQNLPVVLEGDVQIGERPGPSFEILARALAVGLRIKHTPVTHRAQSRGCQSGADSHVSLRARVEPTRLYAELRPRRRAPQLGIQG